MIIISLRDGWTEVKYKRISDSKAFISWKEDFDALGCHFLDREGDFEADSLKCIALLF